MKLFFTIYFLLVFSKSAFPQSENDTIYWSPSYKLKWEDFKGSPNSISKYGATSHPGIKYFLSANEDSFKVRVICFFIKSRSWSKFKTDDTLLMHEQVHFDISELFARKLRQTYEKYLFNFKSVGKDIDNYFLLNKQERNAMDTLYDRQTNFSRNRKQQILWTKKIKIELDKLKKYASF